jgi:hypothetical protein
MGGPWAQHKKRESNREKVAKSTTHDVALVLLAQPVLTAALILRRSSNGGREAVAIRVALPHLRGREAVARALRRESARVSASASVQRA